MRTKHKFHTKYNPLPPKEEFNNGEYLIDAAGYIPPKDRIKNIIRAGERLEEFRREFYDYNGENEDDGYWIDPLRHPGVDLADVSRLQSNALGRLRSRASEKKPKDDSKKSEAKKSETSEAIADADEGDTK